MLAIDQATLQQRAQEVENAAMFCGHDVKTMEKTNRKIPSLRLI